MINTLAFSLERRVFLFALPGIIVSCCVVFLGIYAAISGKAFIGQDIAAQQAFEAQVTKGVNDWRADLVSIENTGEAESVYSARPMNLRMPAVLPPAPLADFGIGAGRLHPTTTKLTGWASAADLFIRYEFSNPTILELGRFDLTFFVVVIVPLLMVAVSFDILAGERERGRATLIAVQAGHINSSNWQRLVLRNSMIWMLVSVIVFVAAFLSPTAQMSGARISSFLAWYGIASVYVFFWFALITFVVACIKKSEIVAAALFSLWAVFVFAVPAIGGALVESAYPPPSRLVFLSEKREGEVEAVREAENLTNSFLAEHPEMALSVEDVPGFFRGAFIANLEAGKRTTPVVEEFALSREKRKALVQQLQILSPAMIANNALISITGGNVDRNMAYQEQARSALNDLFDRIGPSIVAKQRISVAQFDEIPTFTFREKTVVQKLSCFALSLRFLLIVSLFFIAFARRRMSATLESLL